MQASCSYQLSRVTIGNSRRLFSRTATLNAPDDFLSELKAAPNSVPYSPTKSFKRSTNRSAPPPFTPNPRRQPPPPINKYFLHVHASGNNTLLHLMNAQGNALSKSQVSAGLLKYRHKQRSTFDAGFRCALEMLRRVEKENEENIRRRGPQLQLEQEQEQAVRGGGLLAAENAEMEDETSTGLEKANTDGGDQGGRRSVVKAMDIEVVFKGFGQGKQAFFAALTSSEGNVVRPLISRLTDRTAIKIGGERSKKARRL